MLWDVLPYVCLVLLCNGTERGGGEWGIGCSHWCWRRSGRSLKESANDSVIRSHTAYTCCYTFSLSTRHIWTLGFAGIFVRGLLMLINVFNVLWLCLVNQWLISSMRCNQPFIYLYIDWLIIYLLINKSVSDADVIVWRDPRVHCGFPVGK